MRGVNRPPLLLGILLTILPACQSPVRFEVEPALRFGAVSGHFQIPAGGKEGSTSTGRPTLSELGVESTVQPGLALRASSGPHELALDVRYLFLRGSGEADGDLVSQDELFPDGTGLESESGLTTWGLGYGYGIALGSGWTLTPRALLAGISAKYRVVGDNGASTDRSITHFAPGIGGELGYRPEEIDARFSLRAGGTSQWRGRTVQVLEVALRAGTGLGGDVEGWIELGWQRMLLEDTQDVPNQVDVTFAPTLGVGVTIGF